MDKKTKSFMGRVGIIVLYGIIYSLFWKFAGFEMTVIIMGATIIGTQSYNEHK